MFNLITQNSNLFSISLHFQCNSQFFIINLLTMFRKGHLLLSQLFCKTFAYLTPFLFFCFILFSHKCTNTLLKQLLLGKLLTHYTFTMPFTLRWLPITFLTLFYIVSKVLNQVTSLLFQSVVSNYEMFLYNLSVIVHYLSHLSLCYSPNLRVSSKHGKFFQFA